MGLAANCNFILTTAFSGTSDNVHTNDATLP